MQKEIELYELIYLVDPTFTEQELTKKIEHYRNFLMSKGSKVMVQNSGRQNLSYDIKGFKTANYLQMMYLGNGNIVNSLNKELQRDSSILRHLTTKLNEVNK
jgi:small subunit ribosomal protein S6|tara:strand:- start:654 stop:959 length:306 start_codon:yes stop_codon:yes gene_type:complete